MTSLLYGADVTMELCRRHIYTFGVCVFQDDGNGYTQIDMANPPGFHFLGGASYKHFLLAKYQANADQHLPRIEPTPNIY